MGLLTNLGGDAIKAAENLGNQPNPFYVPAAGNIVQQGQEAAQQVFRAASQVVTELITNPGNLTAGSVGNAQKLLDLLKQGTTGVMDGLFKDVDQRITLTAKLSIEPDALLSALAAAMSNAADAVTSSRSTDLLLTEGKIFAEFYVKLPLPVSATGAYARVELNLKSKEYMRLIAEGGV
jgi:hypothetical protein